MMNRNQIIKTVYEASKEQVLVKANIRLKKNGRFSSVEGVIKDIRVNRQGTPFVVIQPIGRHTQSVVLHNIMFIRKQPPVTAEGLYRMISETAYYHAQQRQFTGGNPVEDWLRAEQEVKSIVQVR